MNAKKIKIPNMYIMIDIFFIAFIPIQAANKYMLLSKKYK